MTSALLTKRDWFWIVVGTIIAAGAMILSGLPGAFDP